MKILLDENTPVQVQPALQQVLGDGHEVHHVDTINWNGKKDKNLIPDAVAKGYQALVTKDSNQLEDPDECDILKRSGIHHVRFAQGRGRKGLARSMGALIAAMPEIVDDLEVASSQQLVRVQGLTGGKRHQLTDPKIDPPKYWR